MSDWGQVIYEDGVQEADTPATERIRIYGGRDRDDEVLDHNGRARNRTRDGNDTPRQSRRRSQSPYNEARRPHSVSTRSGAGTPRPPTPHSRQGARTPSGPSHAGPFETPSEQIRTTENLAMVQSSSTSWSAVIPIEYAERLQQTQAMQESLQNSLVQAQGQAAMATAAAAAERAQRETISGEAQSTFRELQAASRREKEISAEQEAQTARRSATSCNDCSARSAPGEANRTTRRASGSANYEDIPSRS